MTLPEYVILLYYYITTKVIFSHEGKNILHIRVVAWLGDPVHLVTTFVTKRCNLQTLHTYSFAFLADLTSFFSLGFFFLDGLRFPAFLLFFDFPAMLTPG